MLNAFSRPTAAWFSGAFGQPTRIQCDGWEAIASGRHTLLVAPTGSGKTLAAFLWALDRTLQLEPDAAPGIRVVYISPLKALAYDVERNLRAPLAGIRGAAGAGTVLRETTVDVRTGDTAAAQRRAQWRRPADILVTTPESLFLVLGSRARAHLASVHTVIVDEIHALAPTKRGAHLALSLERLDELTHTAPQRIGLSATVRPVAEVARFLGGARQVTVVDTAETPALEVEVVVPVSDMGAAAAAPAAGGEEGPAGERGIWPAIYPSLLEVVLANRSTIVFANSRGLCERLAGRLNELAGEALVRAHHGSISHEQRAEMEEALKRGELRGIVATSSLELGIDMGSVDAVVLVESPGTVARGLQRVGRSGHRVGARSVGRVFPKFKGDLLECALVAQRMREGAIEAVSVPSSPLDVLAQQIVAICSDAPRSVDELLRVARGAHPYRDLPRDALTAVLDMLSGHYPSEEFADLTPRLSWDRATDVVQARRGSALLCRLNAGTIPDRGLYGVFLGENGPRIGELDEEMVFETRPGDRIVLGASTWAVEAIGRDRVTVSPAPGEAGRLPFWHGEGPGRPLELGRALGAFTRVLGRQPPESLPAYIRAHAPLDALAARNLAQYVLEQKACTGSLPTDRALTIERFRDELGDWRVCVLSPFGAPVHGPWAMALQRQLGAAAGVEVEVMYTDDGLMLRFADGEPPPALRLLPEPEDVDELVREQLGDTALFSALFRENAARSLLLPRRGPGRRTPLWAQRRRSEALLAAVRKYPGFAVVLETYRQVLGDVFDLEGLKAVLRDVHRGRVRVDEVETRSPSPFARSLVFAYVAAFVYERDAPAAERRAQALTLDRALLAELLGRPALRRLVDPEALAALERELQGLSHERRARDRDELHDHLRRLGDLTLAEVEARAPANQARRWLARLEAERRARPLVLAGEARWVATDDAGLFRAALGSQAHPDLLPEASLGPSERPLERLLRRYARTRGPFTTAEAAARFGLAPARVGTALAALEREGALVQDEIRPGGAGREWCDAEVLKTLKRRTLARLRREIAPVDAPVLARFLPAWHRVASDGRGRGGLLEAIARLEGLALPWSMLARVILPSRVAGFETSQLDALAATGQVVWVGRGALGARDGRIALYRRDAARRLLARCEAYQPPSPAHAAVLRHLDERGASFAFELEGVVGTPAAPHRTATPIDGLLWDLVWAGRITNDTFQPLQALARHRRARQGRAARADRLASGRWSLVELLPDPAVSETERTLARAEVLLARYGVVSREAALAEEPTGGFTLLYRALSALEEAGRVRRGYFVEGLSGAQFAAPDAVERLRAAREAGDDATALTTVLPALDPANPYGALLPWPPTAEAPSNAPAQRPRRVGGAWVALWQGVPVLYAGAGARQLLTFPCALALRPRAFECALHALERASPERRSLLIERIDGIPARESPYRARLEEEGYRSDPRGLVQARTYA